MEEIKSGRKGMGPEKVVKKTRQNVTARILMVNREA